MKNVLWMVCLAIVFPSTANAQQAELPAPRSNDGFFVPEREPPANGEARYQRDETPRQLVIRNAAMRAAQRRERMAINARFGYSPSRPPSSTVPSMGSPIRPPTELRIYTVYPGIVFPRQAAYR